MLLRGFLYCLTTVVVRFVYDIEITIPPPEYALEAKAKRRSSQGRVIPIVCLYFVIYIA